MFSYSYDPEGNRTARFIDSNANGLLDAGDTTATTYAWDHRNRLIRVTDYDLYGDPATRAVDFLYDTENRWIGRDVDLDADGQIDTRTRFAYDGNQIVMQFDRAAAPSDDPADPLTIDHLSHRYLWNPAAVDQLMADEHVTTDPSSPGTILWPLADHLGTIRDLAAYDSSTDATTVVNHRTFDAYGNLQSQTNAAVDCLFGFTGRPLDQETSLQNNLHRWYDAAVGRWMSEDPIGFEGKDGNLYGYVGNGPVNGVDPSGLDPYAQMRLQMQLGWIREAEAKKAEREAERRAMFEMLVRDKEQVYTSEDIAVESGTFVIRAVLASTKHFINVNIRFSPYDDSGFDAASIHFIQLVNGLGTQGWILDGAADDKYDDVVTTPYWKANQLGGQWFVNGVFRDRPATGVEGRTAWMLDQAGSHPQSYWAHFITLVVYTDGEGKDVPMAYIRWSLEAKTRWWSRDWYSMYTLEVTSVGNGEPVVYGDVKFFDVIRQSIAGYNR